jgi:hypothetical protein
VEIEELLAREAIRETMARYVSAADRGCYSELVEVFAPDGVITFGKRARYEGRDAIIASMTESARSRGAYGEKNFQRHILGQPIIRMVDSDNARAVTYILVITELGIDASGVHIDDFIRLEDRWLIARRYANMEWGRTESRGAKHFGPDPTPRHLFD